MKTNAARQSGHACQIRFSDSKETVEQAINKRVLADAVEQIAIENNQRALALRDNGQTAEARQVLYENAGYLRSKAEYTGSRKLDGYAGENETDADNLDEANWTRQRKVMRESQSSRQTQR
jgi:Ca-activated chloride channel family protein